MPTDLIVRVNVITSNNKRNQRPPAKPWWASKAVVGQSNAPATSGKAASIVAGYAACYDRGRRFCRKRFLEGGAKIVGNQPIFFFAYFRSIPS